MSEWKRVCSVDEVPVLGARVVNTSQGEVAVFRNAADEVFAVFDKCPHKAGPLSQGIVHGRSVTCPLHSWKINLEDGQALAPDVGCTKHYPTKVEDNVVFIQV